MNSSIPKVFISYSWTVGDKVLELAERLLANGVDVVLDKWDLKEGQDKYTFMEQAVNNAKITRVLIICDRSYAQKANDRTGGVGDETVIISSEVYGNVKQEKFIPIIFEKDENERAYLPTYINSRIYIDLSNENNYEAEYEKLLRNLHGKPEHNKPKLGEIPEWLNEKEDVSFSAVRDLIKQVKGYNGGSSTKVDFFARRAIDEFSQALKSFGYPSDCPIDNGALLKQIDAMKPLRDYFLDYIEALISKDISVGEMTSDYFESLYNNLLNTSSENAVLELYRYFIWESFICTIAILLHYEKYEDVNKILARTYFLTIGAGRYENAYTFGEFRQYFRIIEDWHKPNSENPNWYTLAGNILTKREKKPIITKEKIVETDLILYQLSCAFEISRWFPSLYVYSNDHRSQTIWTRLQSKRYCEKLFPLFGVNSIDDLKKKVSLCVHDHEYRYSRSFDTAPNILTSIKAEEIGVLN